MGGKARKTDVTDGQTWQVYGFFTAVSDTSFDANCPIFCTFAVHPINEVLAEVDDNILLIVVDLLGILDKQFRPHLVHWLNIIVLFNYIKLYKIKLYKNLQTSHLEAEMEVSTMTWIDSLCKHRLSARGIFELLIFCISCYKTQQLILGTGIAIWWLTEPHWLW